MKNGNFAPKFALASLFGGTLRLNFRLQQTIRDAEAGARVTAPCETARDQRAAGRMADPP